jgi:thiaminase
MAFATNWSKLEFKSFVEDLATLVDDLYKDVDLAKWRQAEDIWQRTVELEEGFWPVKGEEIELRDP